MMLHPFDMGASKLHACQSAKLWAMFPVVAVIHLHLPPLQLLMGAHQEEENDFQNYDFRPWWEWRPKVILPTAKWRVGRGAQGEEGGKTIGNALTCWPFPDPCLDSPGPPAC